MKVQLKSVGKKFSGNWIFRDIDLLCESPRSVGIVGTNGSGKSTLLQIISGYMIPSKGEVSYVNSSEAIPIEKIYRHVSFASPYLQLEDDLTLKENIWFYKQFKDLDVKTDTEFCDRSLFSKAELDKTVRDFSSGMKHRLKLAFALYAKTDIKLFDEPFSNLDHRGMQWFENEFQDHCKDKLVFLNSNHQERELALTEEQLNIEDFK